MNHFNFDDLYEDACPACDHRGPMLLGVLGDLVHLRCRSCGGQYSRDAADYLVIEESDNA